MKHCQSRTLEETIWRGLKCWNLADPCLIGNEVGIQVQKDLCEVCKYMYIYIYSILIINNNIYIYIFMHIYTHLVWHLSKGNFLAAVEVAFQRKGPLSPRRQGHQAHIFCDAVTWHHEDYRTGVKRYMCFSFVSSIAVMLRFNCWVLWRDGKE